MLHRRRNIRNRKIERKFEENKDEEKVDDNKNYKILFNKVELDIKDEEPFCKFYYVFYLKDNKKSNEKNSLNFEFNTYLKVWLDNYNPKYLKKNNTLDNNYIIDNSEVKISLDLEEEDYKTKIIIIEIYFEISIKLVYGLLNAPFFLDCDKNSILVHYNENYEVGNIFSYGFKRISDYELYAKDSDKDYYLCLRDKRLKFDIFETSLYELVASKFSEQEIEQINFSLNNVVTNGYFGVLVYKKNLYEIRPEKVEVTGYQICLLGKKNLFLHSGASGNGERFIMKELKINGTQIRRRGNSDKNDDNDDREENWFSSDSKSYNFNIDLDLQDYIILIEFKAEISIDIEFPVYRLLYDNFGLAYYSQYGTSYKYEIIVDPNIYFPKEQLEKYNYLEMEGKVIFKGYYNFHEKDYNDEEFIKENEEYPEEFKERIDEWKNNKEIELFPESLEFELQ